MKTRAKTRVSSPAARFAYRLWTRAGMWSLVAVTVILLLVAGGFAAARITAGAADGTADDLASDTAGTGEGQDTGPDGDAEAVSLPDLEPVEPALAGQGLLVLHGDDQVTLYLDGHGVFTLLVTEVTSGTGEVLVAGAARYLLDEGGYEFNASQFTLAGTGPAPDGSELPVVTAQAPVTDFVLAFPGAAAPAVFGVSAPEVATGDIDEAKLCLLADGTTSPDILSC